MLLQCPEGSYNEQLILWFITECPGGYESYKFPEGTKLWVQLMADCTSTIKLYGDFNEVYVIENYGDL